MVTFKEMLGNHSISDIPISYQLNMEGLLVKINKIRAAYSKPMIVTSGIRTMVDQMRINPKAPKSNHLTGHAIDIADPGLELTAWLKGPGADLLKEVGLYCEEGNPNWAHFQDIAPKSGRRWFLP